jgi:glycosyltransferase involved in cell wall biosynthesis
MHVLLIHQAFVGPGEPGGTRHLELAIRATRRGHRFTIIASDVNYLTGKQAPRLTEEEVAPGVIVRRTRSSPHLHRSFLWRVLAFLAFMRTSAIDALRVKSVDVVFGTTPPIFQAMSAWMVAAVKRVPFVLEVRDLWPEFAIGMRVLRNPVLISVARALERFLYARATVVIVNSPSYVDYLMAKGLPADRIYFVPNGVDMSMFNPARDGALMRREWGLDGKFVALYAGALGQANDIPTLLGAAMQLSADSDIRIVLIGDGKESQALQCRAAAMGLSNVLFPGSVPKDRMPDALAAADACIAILQNIPVFRITYPNKVFDYMAAAKPTVLAIDGAIRKVIEEAGGGIYVPPGDPVLLATAIRDLAGDREACRRMGVAARTFVAKNFNRDDQASFFVAVLEEAVVRCHE